MVVVMDMLLLLKLVVVFSIVNWVRWLFVLLDGVRYIILVWVLIVL